MSEITTFIIDKDEYAKIRIDHYMDLYRKANKCEMLTDILKDLLSRMDHINAEVELLIEDLEGKRDE